MSSPKIAEIFQWYYYFNNFCINISCYTCYFLLVFKRSTIARNSSKNTSISLPGLFLYYCHKRPNVFEQLSLYSTKLYVGITTWMSLALSVCVLFISLMQSVNGAQFLHTNCILLFSSPAATSATVIVPITRIYASL